MVSKYFSTRTTSHSVKLRAQKTYQHHQMQLPPEHAVPLACAYRKSVNFCVRVVFYIIIIVVVVIRPMNPGIFIVPHNTRRLLFFFFKGRGRYLHYFHFFSSLFIQYLLFLLPVLYPCTSLIKVPASGLMVQT